MESITNLATWATGDFVMPLIVGIFGYMALSGVRFLKAACNMTSMSDAEYKAIGSIRVRSVRPS